MPYQIRQTDNLFDIVNLNELIFPGELIDVSRNIRGWIAYDENRKPIGFCTCTDIGYGLLFLSRCGVLPHHRRNGLHKRLLTVREQHARKEDYKMVITYVHKDNTSSWVNFVKRGYEVYEPEYDYAGKDFLYFRKKLLY